MEESDRDDERIKLNHQLAINDAFDWYVVQKQPFSNNMGSDDLLVGKYRGDNGAKSPIGLLLTDEEYTPEIEGRAPLMLPTDNPLRFLIDYDLQFLLELERLHDECLPLWIASCEAGARTKFETLMELFALKWELDVPFSLVERG